MDQVYRQLLQFPLEDIAMIAKSAYHVRNLLDNNNPDSDTESSDQ